MLEQSILPDWAEPTGYGLSVDFGALLWLCILSLRGDVADARRQRVIIDHLCRYPAGRHAGVYTGGEMSPTNCMKYQIHKVHRNSADEDILQDIRRVATIIGKPKLTRDEYKEYGEYGTTTIRRHFGSWDDALLLAGLTISHCGISKHETCNSEDDFFQDLRDVATRLGAETVTTDEYRMHGRYNYSHMVKVYHSWDVILKKAGLNSTKYRIGKGKQISAVELFKEMQRVWDEIERQPKVKDFHNGLFKFSLNAYCRRFGSWQK